MSKVETQDLADRYKGVVDHSLSHQDPIGLLKPAGMSLLKEHYNKLPDYTHEGRLEKVGLTDEGYVVYRNKITDRLVYRLIWINHEGVELGRHWGRDSKDKEPHEGFGEKFIITP